MLRHFTATAFVRDDQGRVLLLWHRRLRRWMPPGGHVDADETPDETARRECREETGLDVHIIGDHQPDLFADASEEGRMLPRPWMMLEEEIPASAERSEPAHRHMDFLYLARPLHPDQPLRREDAEASELRWFTPEEVEALPPGTIYANVRAYLRYMRKEYPSDGPIGAA